MFIKQIFLVFSFAKKKALLNNFNFIYFISKNKVKKRLTNNNCIIKKVKIKKYCSNSIKYAKTTSVNTLASKINKLSILELLVCTSNKEILQTKVNKITIELQTKLVFYLN